MRRRVAHGVLVACGVCIFAWLVARIGLDDLRAAFSALSWRLVIVLVFPCVIFKTFDTLGWYFAFPGERAGFLTLVKTRLIGQAVNSTTPTASIGGDAAKAWLLRGEVRMSECLSSLVVARTTMTVAQGLFLLIGVVVARRGFESASRLIPAMTWLLALEGVAIAGFVGVQMRGPFSAGHGLLRRFGMFERRDVGGTAAEVDRMLAMFYRRQPGRLTLSLTFHMLGWLASAAEVWVILDLLGMPVSVAAALVIEAFGTGIRFATFFVPSQVGFAEGGTVATFLALGLSGAAGLTFSVVRRLRELAWVGVGLLLAGAHRTGQLAENPVGS
jgi:putative membrane protein